MAKNKPIIICKIVYESNGQNFTAYIGSTSLDEAAAHVRQRVPGSRITESGKQCDIHEFTRPVINMLSEQLNQPVANVQPQPQPRPQRKTVSSRPTIK